MGFALSEIETAPVVPNCAEEDASSHMETSDESMKKPRGRGRPRKERSAVVVKRSRGRPSKLSSTVSDVMASHHNYSNGGALNSTLTTDERRYRRMRDLNNVASQRCRLRRKEQIIDHAGEAVGRASACSQGRIQKTSGKPQNDSGFENESAIKEGCSSTTSS